MKNELIEYTFTVTKIVVVRAHSRDAAFQLAIGAIGETHTVALQQISRLS